MVEINASNLSLREINSRIKEAVSRNEKVIIRNACHIHGLAAGLTRGEIIVEGDVGDYLGMLNSGARIHVKGCAGNYVGDGGWSGEIIVEGDAGTALGYTPTAEL